MNLRLVKSPQAPADVPRLDGRADAIEDERSVCVALLAKTIEADDLPRLRLDMFVISVYGVIVEGFREAGYDVARVGGECIRRGYSDGPATLADLWPIPGVDPIPSPADTVAACLRIHQRWQCRTLSKKLHEAAEIAAVGALPVDAIAERVRETFREVRS